MTFHDLVDQEQYNKNPIERATITFFDARGEVVLTDSFRLFRTATGSEPHEYQLKIRAGEKFRDAVCRQGVVKT